MDGYAAYRYYLALKLHFTTDKYDVFENQGRVSARRASFENRNDRGLFERMAIKRSSPRELIDFFVANFANYNLTMMYDQGTSEEIYKKWIKYKESLSYNFSKECSIIEDTSKTDPFDSSDGSPHLMNLYVADKISIQTMSILNDYEGYINRWDNIKFVWSTQFRTITKLKKFVKYDSRKLYQAYDNLKENLKELNHGTHVS